MAIPFLVSPPCSDATLQARREWERFIETLGCAGQVTLVELASDRLSPDLTFTANAALICGSLAIVASSARPERHGSIRHALSQAGLATISPLHAHFEGASDALFDPTRPLCYGGYGWCTDRAALFQLQELVACRVMPLALVDERFFHLNMALCPLRTVTSSHTWGRSPRTRSSCCGMRSRPAT
jgi:N-dimethylarginine dimethylaminohydrolase